MRAWSQTKGQNNQVPRDGIVLWYQTFEFWDNQIPRKSEKRAYDSVHTVSNCECAQVGTCAQRELD